MTPGRTNNEIYDYSALPFKVKEFRFENGISRAPLRYYTKRQYVMIQRFSLYRMINIYVSLRLCITKIKHCALQAHTGAQNPVLAYQIPFGT